MAVEAAQLSRRERWLALMGAGVFALIGLAAAMLWLREGELVYVMRIFNDIADCL